MRTESPYGLITTPCIIISVSSKFAKLKGVILSLENSEQRVNNLCRTLREIRDFAEFYDLSVTFDIKHLLDIAEEFYDLVGRFRNVHVSNSDE
ncbi:MAG: hypothetical protein V6S10_04790 [Candidatus Methanoglobus sp.]